MALIAVATFVLIFSIVVAPYWLLIARPEDNESARLKGRLVHARKQNRAVAGLLREEPRPAPLKRCAVQRYDDGFVKSMQNAGLHEGDRRF